MDDLKTIDASRSVIISDKGEDFINLQRVKIQLKKILDEHQLVKQREEKESPVRLIKLERNKKKELTRLRYKQ